MQPPIPQAPVPSFLAGNPEIAALNQSSFNLPLSQGITGARLNQAQDEETAAKQAAAEAKQRAADLSDKSKYQVVPSKDGGYNFFAPDGTQVDIATLTQRTGTKAADWLKDSQDPTDIQYLQDSQNLQKFMNAVSSKDTKTIDSFTYSDPNLKKYTSGKGGIHNLVQDFYNNYQRYYVPQSQDPQAWGSVPGNPTVSAAQNNPFYVPKPPTKLTTGSSSGGFHTR